MNSPKELLVKTLAITLVMSALIGIVVYLAFLYRRKRRTPSGPPVYTENCRGLVLGYLFWYINYIIKLEVYDKFIKLSCGTRKKRYIFYQYIYKVNYEEKKMQKYLCIHFTTGQGREQIYIKSGNPEKLKSIIENQKANLYEKRKP